MANRTLILFALLLSGSNVLAAVEKDQKIRIRMGYRAIFDDPVPVRPVNADNPAGGDRFLT